MRVRDTSISAFNYIKENGILSKRRWEVYEVLFYNGPLTGNELFALMGKEKKTYQSNVVTRLGELRDMGAVVEIGSKIDSITGMTVILWDVTSLVPVRLNKDSKKTSKQRIKELEEQVKVLEDRLRGCTCRLIQRSLFGSLFDGSDS